MMIHSCQKKPSPCACAPPSLAQILAGTILTGLLLAQWGCSTKTPSYEELSSAEELYSEGLDVLSGRRLLGLFKIIDYDLAIEHFQSIIDNYPYSQYELLAQLKIADAYFADHRFEEALAYYQDFADLHPEHEQVPYSLLQAALCHYNQIESIDRDQNATHRATEALDLLIQKYPYAEQTRRAEELTLELRTQLALHELEVADFYRDRTHWQSAADRYRRVLDEYPGLGLDARSLYRLGLCLEEMKRADEALRLYHVVVENYSETPSAREARLRIARNE